MTHSTLFQIIIPPSARRNYSEIYNKMTVAELEAAVPGIKFTNYLSALLPRPVTDQESVLMFALPYFNKLTDLIEETDKR